MSCSQVPSHPVLEPLKCTHPSTQPGLCPAVPVLGVLQEPSENSIHPSRPSLSSKDSPKFSPISPLLPGGSVLPLGSHYMPHRLHERLAKLYASINWLRAGLVPAAYLSVLLLPLSLPYPVLSTSTGTHGSSRVWNSGSGF